jgi:hypothetical protein
VAGPEVESLGGMWFTALWVSRWAKALERHGQQRCLLVVVTGDRCVQSCGCNARYGQEAEGISFKACILWTVLKASIECTREGRVPTSLWKSRHSSFQIFAGFRLRIRLPRWLRSIETFNKIEHKLESCGVVTLVKAGWYCDAWQTLMFERTGKNSAQSVGAGLFGRLRQTGPRKCNRGIKPMLRADGDCLQAPCDQDLTSIQVHRVLVTAGMHSGCLQSYLYSDRAASQPPMTS